MQQPNSIPFHMAHPLTNPPTSTCVILTRSDYRLANPSQTCRVQYSSCLARAILVTCHTCHTCHIAGPAISQLLRMEYESNPCLVLTYLLTYLLTYVRTYLRTYLLTCLLAYLLTHLLACLLAYLLAYFLTYLLAYLLAYLRTYLLAYL